MTVKIILSIVIVFIIGLLIGISEAYDMGYAAGRRDEWLSKKETKKEEINNDND